MSATAYLVPTLIILAIMAFDRVFFQRGKVKLISLEKQGIYKGNLEKFSVMFSSREPLMHSVLECHLRDKNNPTTVIVGKERTLAFSKSGLNNESLLFNHNMIEAGEWELCVKVTSQGSRINPFYMIFPITNTITREVNL